MKIGKKNWETTLVGYVIGKRLPFTLVNNATRKFWAKDGLVDTLAIDSNYFFFKFASFERRCTILENSPRYIAGQPFF